MKRIPLIYQILVGLVIGISATIVAPEVVPFLSIFGNLFVKALKGVAPLLVFILVLNAMIQRKKDGNITMKPIVIYVFGTFAASIVGVAMSFLFPTNLHLQLADASVKAPSGIAEVLHNVILNIVDNPVNALINANYIGILAWALIIGFALHSSASDSTKSFFQDLATAITKVVTWVIRFAPIGIMGLVAESVGASGLSALLGTIIRSTYRFLCTCILSYESIDCILLYTQKPIPVGMDHTS